jgi:hypothetical protein
VAKAKPDDVVEGTAVEEGAVQGSAPAPAELAVRPDVPEDVFRAMDAHDELQILEALEGRPAEIMVYSFRSGGKTQTGLSYAGVAEVVRTMNAAGHTKIRVSPEFAPIVEEVQEADENGDVITYVQVTVYAEDALTGGGNYGTARQQKFMTYRDENRKPTIDKFAFTKALSKAQRNAMLPLTPVMYRETLIAQMLNNAARVKELRLGMGDPTTELPPPLTDDRAVELKERIRATFKEIRDVDPMALLPGQFNAKLRRTEHEHEAMEELLAALEAQLAHVKAASS